MLVFIIENIKKDIEELKEKRAKNKEKTIDDIEKDVLEELSRREGSIRESLKNVNEVYIDEEE